MWYITVQSHSDNIELAPKYVKSVLKNSWPDIIVYIYICMYSVSFSGGSEAGSG